MKRLHGVSAAVVAITVVMAITAGAARAAIGIAVGDPTLSTDRNSISVPVTVSCSPFDPSLTFFSASAAVSVEQAVGRQIATGFGSVGGFMGGTQIAYNWDRTLTSCRRGKTLGSEAREGGSDAERYGAISLCGDSVR